MFSEESLQRIDKIKRMKNLGIIPYAAKFDKKHDIKDLFNVPQTGFRDINDIIPEPKSDIITAGRITLYRSFGKISFAKLQDGTGEIQIMFSKENCSIDTGIEIKTALTPKEILSKDQTMDDVPAFKIIEKLVDVGDFIGIKGELFLTHKGELTIFVKEFKFLTKAIRPLPEKFHGIQDQESIYRQRYLDLIMNKDSYDRFLFRSNFIRVLRDFYYKNGFLEIETPVLGSSASGAAAAPFITHHNDYDTDFFLHISPETSLKKATVGRFEKVFEVARNFRNEGSDPSHMQEFTMVEHYAVYWDFEDNMKFAESMFDFLFKNLGMDKIVKIKDKLGNIRDVDFSTPWERVDYIEGVKKASGIDVMNYSQDDAEKLRKDIKEKGIQFEGMDKMGVTTLIDYLYKKVLRPNIIGPSIIYNYPKLMQPLARISDKDDNIVEQFQVVVNGWEILKAYSELVDPILQKSNFDDQAKAQAAGDDEATSGDDDFVLAMEYGMPCQSGFGMGIDRIVTLLTGQDNLRDSILFPLTKPENCEIKIEGKSKDTKVAVAIINKGAKMEKWQELNTIAHLSSAFAARLGKSLFLQDTIETIDNEKIKLNIQHAIIIKQSENQNDFNEIIKNSQEKGLEISEFTREMMGTTDDKKVISITKNKNYSEVEYLGILIFGNKKEVDEITKGFGLIS